MYGIASGPALWQITMEKILHGIKGVKVMLDDIAIAAGNEYEFTEILEKVFKRLNYYNIKINEKKCVFFASEITYCGYIIGKNGLQKDSSKFDAITKMLRPRNVTEV